MMYLNKLLEEIEKNFAVLKSKQMVLTLGLSATQIKDLKKYALDNMYIEQTKNGCFLTSKGKHFLEENPIEKWNNEKFPLRPEINLEYLKEEKTPSILTKAIRNYAKYLLENQPLKEFSLEFALFEDMKKCEKIISIIEKDLLNGKKQRLDNIFSMYIQKGLTKSLISLAILTILNRNIDKIAIYEKRQFQLNFDTLMFDRIIACPQNFEIQKTVMGDEYILKDISKIILNKKSDNILEITKGLYKIVKNLDKYTMNTQNLSKKLLGLEIL